MFKNIPTPLVIMAAIYVTVELTLILMSKNWIGLIPVGLFIVVFFFAARGSRIASFLWGLLFLLGAIGSGHMALQLMKMQHAGAAFLAAYCVFFLASAGYIFFSPALRRHYARRASAG